MLSIKGREPFIRMHLWLKDPQSVDKLQALKSERRDGGGAKRKRLAGGTSGGGGSGFDSSSDRSSPADQTDFYGSSADSPGGLSKKPRMIFSEEQRESLKIAFTLDPYPSTTVIDFLGQELNLEPRSVSNWFHNHRMRLKQQLPPGMDNLPFPREGGGQAFEAVTFRLLRHQKMSELHQQQQQQSDDSNGATTPTALPPPSASAVGLPGSMSSFLRQFGLPDPSKVVEGGGLDLTFKSNDEKDSAASSDDEDAAAKVATNPAIANAAAIVAAAAAMSSGGGGGGGSRSRRKPAAPQWLRPEWVQKAGTEEKREEDEEREAADGDDVTINGVCVMRGKSLSSSSKKDEKDADENTDNGGGDDKAGSGDEEEEPAVCD